MQPLYQTRADRASKAALFLLGLRLLLLLGDLLRRARCLVDQGRRLAVFLALSDQGEPSAGHVEKGAFALGVAGLLSKSNALNRVCAIFSGVRHTQLPD